MNSLSPCPVHDPAAPLVSQGSANWQRTRLVWSPSVPAGDRPGILRELLLHGETLRQTGADVTQDVLWTVWPNPEQAYAFAACHDQPGTVVLPVLGWGAVGHPEPPQAFVEAAQAADLPLSAYLSRAVRKRSGASGIEWTGEGWSPWRGCDEVSPGCTNCYAKQHTHRGQFQMQRGLTTHVPGEGVVWTGEVRLQSGTLLYKPLENSGAQLFFATHYSDVFHAQVPWQWLRVLHRIMALRPDAVFQVLTKRPHLAQRFYAAHPECLLPNVWLGVSVENRSTLKRASILRGIPVPHDQRFLSMEPLLGPVQLTGTDLDGIRWVITGGESGGRAARVVDVEWVRGIRDACLLHGVPFFHKQWGAKPTDVPREWMDHVHAKHNGAVLDGRLWREMPEEMEAVF